MADIIGEDILQRNLNAQQLQDGEAIMCTANTHSTMTTLHGLLFSYLRKIWTQNILLPICILEMLNHSKNKMLDDLYLLRLNLQMELCSEFCTAQEVGLPHNISIIWMMLSPFEKRHMARLKTRNCSQRSKQCGSLQTGNFASQTKPFTLTFSLNGGTLTTTTPLTAASKTTTTHINDIICTTDLGNSRRLEATAHMEPKTRE